ncbi:cytosolic endo-beta-N-acetylglucosaminidase isoform X2 [Gouania willdenowi]|nr:cytosolic endo-beta-N-acetylglucosaminidase isoform X2 [Gouania willdenowi]
MMGGYLDDRYIQGSDAEAPYAFYHWNHIDVFNYFSHRMVTIPPAVWTNAAHRHGVPVLGTFITEWTDGAVTCESFLKDEDSYRGVADKLVQISHCYRFDGWLINIENTLSEAAVKNTPLFLRYLSEQMHERVPGSLVLWYDSVVESGELKWQNELNQSNKMFFDACDGFFTNYNWTEPSLEWMSSYSGLQGRHNDIYVGVDVFARGKVVGGMFDTNKALEVIRRHNFSVAIFAPGWVYEVHTDKTQFRRNQDKFWALLSPYLHVHRLTSGLPFISSFCQGFGKAVYHRGQPESCRSWFNLTAQEVQPLYEHMMVSGRGWLSCRGCPDNAWNGGCSLLLEGLIPADHSSVCAKIFSLHTPLPSKTLVVLVCKASEGVQLSLQLLTADAAHCTHVHVHEVQELGDGHRLRKRLSELCGNLDVNGWSVRCSEMELHSCVLREVCVKMERAGGPEEDTVFSCRVGEVMFLDVSSLQEPSQQVVGLCIFDVVWLRGAGHPQHSASTRLLLNATLQWEHPVRPVRHFRVHWRHLRGPDPRTPPGQLELVGRAYCNPFRVTELAVSDPPGLLELLVEPVLREGFLVPESQWGRRSLSYSKEVLQ